MTILVIGGTGIVGSEVVRALANAGEAVRATSRRPARFEPGVDGAILDLSDPATLRAALSDVEAVFAYADPETADGLVDEMQSAGVRRLVLLSSADAADADLGSFNARRHREPELVVERSELDWTFLRPVAFASNALFWKEQIRFAGTVRTPYPNASQSLIDPRDIGRVAAIALTSSDLVGAAPILTGPESLSQRLQVEILAAALGRPIGFEEITPEQTRAMLKGILDPAFIELKLTVLEDATAHPDPVTDAVQTITGQLPGAFAAWAEARAAAFL